jgi:hypothetical protein
MDAIYARDWGVRGSFYFSLGHDFYFMEYSLQLFRDVLVMLIRVIDLLACWWSFGRLRSAAVWKMTPIFLFRCSWWEMNNFSFKGLESTWRRFYPGFTILCIFGLRLMCTICHLCSFCFGVKWFMENDFGIFRCLVEAKIIVNRKMISVWPKMLSKFRKMIYAF